ncbi:MAG: hypothetical protein AAB421_04390 [Patescibacteria group bacterium]
MSNAPHVDLDKFLKAPGSGAGAPPPVDYQRVGQRAGSSTTPVGGGLVQPNRDRLVIVGILADNSGSIAGRGLEGAIREGLALSINAFRGAKGADFYIKGVGFKGDVYFDGMIRDIPENAVDSYAAGRANTPIVHDSIVLLTDLHAKAQVQRDKGIQTTVAMIILTDDEPAGDSGSPPEFAAIISEGDYITGIGAAEDESAVGRYTSLFGAMGISKILTPKADPREVRRALNQVSQSVATIAAA